MRPPSADTVERHVAPAAAGRFAHDVGHVARIRACDGCDAVAVEARAFLRIAHERDDARAAGPRELDGGVSHRTGGAGHEHPLAFAHAGVVHQRRPRGDERHADRRGLLRREIVRAHGDRIARHDEELRMRAVAQDAEVSARAPHFGALQLRRPAAHAPSVVAPENARERRVREPSLGAHDVAGIDARRLDRDAHVPRAE
jgi:hypothetical protein